MRHQTGWNRTAAVLLLAATTACYKEVPLQTSVPAPATHIVAQLTDSGTVGMANLIGSGAQEIEGIVTSADENVWQMQMVRVVHRDQREIEWNHEMVTFPRSILLSPTIRTLDKKASWLAAAGITVGAILAARAFNLIGSDNSKNEDPTPQQILIPFGERRE
ncbi:MAG TPA: hypothetical protein VF021_10810 [Longimicrobiales bacterium]